MLRRAAAVAGRGAGRRISCSVQVRGLPAEVRREELFEQCEDFGRVASLYITPSSTGKQSIATVTFKTIGSAIAIVDELNDMNMMGRRISVNFSTTLNKAPTAPRSPQSYVK